MTPADMQFSTEHQEHQVELRQMPKSLAFSEPKWKKKNMGGLLFHREGNIIVPVLHCTQEETEKTNLSNHDMTDSVLLLVLKRKDHSSMKMNSITSLLHC